MFGKKKKEAAYVSPPYVLTAGQMTAEQAVTALVFPDGLEFHSRTEPSRFVRDALRLYSLVSTDDEDFATAQEICYGERKDVEWSLNSAMGCLVGNVVGDALGAPLEFKAVTYDEPDTLKEMGDECWTKNRFFLKPGQWTDDGSMALCIADTLLVHGDPLDCRDLRLRFLCWWEFGLNNAFSLDESRRGGGSVGLGGNISMSFGDFIRNKQEFTAAGDTSVSGNGSVMRNGAIPCRFWNDTEAAMETSSCQSRTTHQGIEAAECSKLLSFVCTKAAQNPGFTARQVLSLLTEFRSPCYSVQCLAKSQDEEAHESNASMNLQDRKWNWKADQYRYAESRARASPGYVGSYCMDATAMALHCLWTTRSFREATLKCVNYRGDADSTGAVCAQMAGAIYGVQSIPAEWLRHVNRWDAGLTALRAFKLYHGRRVQPLTVAHLERLMQLEKEFYESTLVLSPKK